MCVRCCALRMATTVAAFVTVKRVGKVLNAMSQRVNVKCPAVLATDDASKVNVTANAVGRDRSATRVSLESQRKLEHTTQR